MPSAIKGLFGALIALSAAPGILQSLTGMYPPYAAKVARRAYKTHPDLIPSTDELVGMRIRNVLDDSRFHDLMAQAGFSLEVADKLHQGARQYMTALDYITLWRRGDIKETEADRLMSELGFDPSEISRVKLVTLYAPTPQDVIRFAVRDVYTPQTIEEYGLDKDIPANYHATALKVGLPTSTADQYWMAHWELPSPTQVYTMLHRGLLTEEQVTTYLKVADYMPYWRDKLAAISYNPLTRVDVRRMHAMGVLSDEDVYKAYKDDGYNDHNARLMTEFTVKLNTHKEGETPKGVVIDAYNSGVIDRPTAVSRLKALKFSDESIQVILDTADEDVKQELIDLKADAIIDHFNAGGLTMGEVQTELTVLGVPARMMEIVIARELAQARKRAKVASKSDLDKWYTMGLISSSVYTTKMQQLGYGGVDIALFVDELDISLVHGADKKLPYAIPFRQYMDNQIGYGELEVQLVKLEYKDPALSTLLRVAQRIKG